MSYNFVYNHWVPKAAIKQDFPFVYKTAKSTFEEYSESTNKLSIEIETTVSAAKLKTLIKNKLISSFNYYKYLNKYSKDYKKFEDYHIEIKRYNIEGTGRKATIIIEEHIYLRLTDIVSNYSFNLVPSIEELNNLLTNNKIQIISFDTETTGLNPEEDTIVGVSLALRKGEGYYIPIAHDSSFEEYNLGMEAVELIYEALTKAEVVFMFNARFDMRMLEFAKSSYFLDTSKIKYNDAQLNAHFADPEFRQFGLKYLEKHFLGYDRPDLRQTLSASKIKDFNFKFINPELGLFYAATDAITTLELGLETYKYYKEFGISGDIDQQLVFILMRYENFAGRVDYNFAKEQLSHITNRLKELDIILNKATNNANLNSSKVRMELLQSFNLDTGERTKGGQMATGMPAIQAMLERMKEDGEEYPEWLELLDERAKLEKLNNTFFGRIVEQAKETQRLRINYRLGVTSTGRLSSGKFTGGE